MEKRRINKLVVPLTLKTVSILGAFTVISTSIGGCENKKKNTDEEINKTTVTTSNKEIETTNNIEITTTIPSETTVQTTTTKTTNTNETTVTKNTTTKTTNQTKPKTTIKTQVTTMTTTQSSEEDDILTDFIPLTKDNINNIDIFKKAVHEVSRETRGYFILIWKYEYNGKEYRKTYIPEEEFTYLLASLNQDYLKEEALNTLLGTYSEDDLKRCCHIIQSLLILVEESDHINNWDGLILDSNIKKQFIAIEKALLEYMHSNPKPLQELLENYDYNNNPLVGRYLSEACLVALSTGSYKDENINSTYSSLYWNELERSEQEASKMYNKIHGKTKVLE